MWWSSSFCTFLSGGLLPCLGSYALVAALLRLAARAWSLRRPFRWEARVCEMVTPWCKFASVVITRSALAAIGVPIILLVLEETHFRVPPCPCGRKSFPGVPGLGCLLFQCFEGNLSPFPCCVQGILI